MDNVKEVFIDLETGRKSYTYYSYEEMQEIERQKQEAEKNRPKTQQEQIDMIIQENNNIYESILDNDFRLTNIELGL